MAFALHHGAPARLGVHDGGSWPPSTVPRRAYFAGRNAGGPRFAPFWGQRWTRLAFADARSTGTTGAWPSPTTTAALAAEGCRPEVSAIGIVVPVVASGSGPFTGKKAWGPLIRRPLGAAMDSPAFELFDSFSRREKYCRNGAMAFAQHPASPCQGSKMAMVALPAAVPRTGCYAGGKWSLCREMVGVRDCVFWGPEWARLALARWPLERPQRRGGVT
jgi:hypothetical protein